jgi:hypothetical protein
VYVHRYYSRQALEEGRMSGGRAQGSRAWRKKPGTLRRPARLEERDDLQCIEKKDYYQGLRRSFALRRCAWILSATVEPGAMTKAKGDVHEADDDAAEQLLTSSFASISALSPQDGKQETLTTHSPRRTGRAAGLTHHAMPRPSEAENADKDGCQKELG